MNPTYNEAAFKQTWHEADLTPNAEAMYEEARQIIKNMEKFNHTTTPFRWRHDLRFLDVHPDSHRRVVPDIEEARAMMTLFFPSEFLFSQQGEKFKDSLLLDQAQRASRGPSKIRSHTSNKYRPQNFWAEWDSIRKEAKNEKPLRVEHKYRDWDKSIRPIIAKLYKAGVIGNAHLPYPPGQAIVQTESDRDPDLDIDFRVIESDIKFPRDLNTNVPSKEQLLSTARSYANGHPTARFALLRLWSAPHFYPLMIGYDRRDMTSFWDLLGRAWEWKFIPKVTLFLFSACQWFARRLTTRQDMPFSEISIHNASRLRLQPHRHILGKNVFICRDKFLVMAENEQDLCKFAVATTFAIQTNPWRLEVDLWKSFVNIDLEFLQGLAQEWME